MTEQEWRESQDPNEMLALAGGKASSRRQRLFACACWHLLWHLLDEPARRVVEAMERYADEPLAEGGRLQRACAAANAVLETRGPASGWTLRDAALQMLLQTVWAEDVATRAALGAQLVAIRDAGERAGEGELFDSVRGGREDVQRAQGELVREVFGNAFRPARLDPTWLKANDGAALKLARAIYDERAFAQLPVLGDALEDAGCADAEVLAHCRRGGTHVRGCWVLDAVLGKG